MPVEISDVFGFGKGMEKLLDIASSALGRLSKSYYKRKDIKDRIYEIRKLSNAIKQNQIETGGIFLDGDKISIHSADKLPTYQEISTHSQNELLKRTSDRLILQAMKSQLNVEGILLNASEQLIGENNVSDEPVNQDWLNRFFNIAEEVSTEEMQQIWGKVLAGEIKQPGTFAMRTLDVIRNLSIWEAQRIAYAANFTCMTFFHYFLIFDSELMKKYGIHFLQITELIECGYLQPIESLFGTSSNDISIFVFGDIELEVHHKKGVPSIQFPGYGQTTAGIQIDKLIERKTNFDFVTDLAKILSKDGSYVFYKKDDIKFDFKF